MQALARKASRLGALLAGLALWAPVAWGAGPDWKFLDENVDSRFYWDQSQAKAPGKQPATVQIRTRVVYTDDGKADALKILRNDPKMADLFESHYVYDIDCAKNESKLLEASHLDSNGATLKTVSLKESTEWEAIPPFARLGLVVEKVCPQQ